MSFDTVVGHADARAAIERSIVTGRLAHAYLFVGDDGIGKRTLAIAVARALVCERRGEFGDHVNACGKCGACIRVARDSHPDVLVSRFDAAAGSVKVGDIRAMEEFLQRTALEGGYKVLVVDGAEEMTDAAANAFLKTLEEPPPHSLLILVAQSTSTLPSTVASRCQVIRLRGLDEVDVRRVLVEQASVPDDEATALAAASGGSPGRALALRGVDVLAEAAALTREIVSPSRDSIEAAAAWYRCVRESNKVTYNQASARLRALLLLAVHAVRGSLRRSLGLPGDGLLREETAAVSAVRAQAVLQTLLATLECLDKKAHLELLLEDLFLRSRIDVAGSDVPIPLNNAWEAVEI
ncbi:MAG: DNA polymerase III subunit delta' [Planctomycetes bacterium]|nr:DNA polymerase III subunit delta' [Planctomycetota bacterium]MBI3845818.1 DNA polymerase III subunit delta' [Planctomycetota bacterium]